MRLQFLSTEDTDLLFYSKRINDLARELSPDNALITRAYLAVMTNRSRVLIASEGDYPVGMGILVPEIKATGPVGTIHDVVVTKSRRGQGISKTIMEKLENEAVRLGLPIVGLTSHPSRMEANNLYRNRGYEQRETNVYGKLLYAPCGF